MDKNIPILTLESHSAGIVAASFGSLVMDKEKMKPLLIRRVTGYSP